MPSEQVSVEFLEKIGTGHIMQKSLVVAGEEIESNGMNGIAPGNRLERFVTKSGWCVLNNRAMLGFQLRPWSGLALGQIPKLPCYPSFLRELASLPKPSSPGLHLTHNMVA